MFDISVVWIIRHLHQNSESEEQLENPSSDFARKARLYWTSGLSELHRCAS
jgi:hypothetical protein